MTEFGEQGQYGELSEHDKEMMQTTETSSNYQLTEDEKSDPINAYQKTMASVRTKQAWANGNTPTGFATPEETSKFQTEANDLIAKASAIENFINKEGTDEQKATIEKFKNS